MAIASPRSAALPSPTASRRFLPSRNALASSSPKSLLLAACSKESPQIAVAGEQKFRNGGLSIAAPVTRREYLLAGAAMMPFVMSKPYSEAREVDVGTFLPPSPTNPSFVVFQATSKDTPALRADKLIFRYKPV